MVLRTDLRHKAQKMCAIKKIEIFVHKQTFPNVYFQSCCPCTFFKSNCCCKENLVCCKEKNGKINILTDGDIRRNSNNLYKKKISKICNNNPNWISDSATALSAIEMMNSKKITSLLVLYLAY